MLISRPGLLVRSVLKHLHNKKSVHEWNINFIRSRYFCLYSFLRLSKFEPYDKCDRARSRHDTEELLENSVTSAKEEIGENSLWSSPAYPKCETSRRDQKQKRVQSDIDPRETSVILFPGQGSQYVGMGRGLVHYPEAKYICDIASEFLGYDLLDLCLRGPQETLNRTEYSQMAVFVLSYAAVEQLKVENRGVVERCIATAGFSVGEITALVFAGAISFTEALKLVKVRANAMQAVCDDVPSGMMTVFYGPDSRLEYACVCATDWCIERGVENPVCRIANYLFPHCKVVAGNLEALNFLEQNASAFKLKRLKRLPVSGAFHTSLMKPAADIFKKELKNINICSPKIPVYSNVNGLTYKGVGHIFRQLPQQVYKPVKWEQTLHVLFERTQGENFPHTYECGPGTNLKSCLKMVNAKAWNACTNLPV